MSLSINWRQLMFDLGCVYVQVHCLRLPEYVSKRSLRRKFARETRAPSIRYSVVFEDPSRRDPSDCRLAKRAAPVQLLCRMSSDYLKGRQRAAALALCFCREIAETRGLRLWPLRNSPDRLWFRLPAAGPV